MKPLTAEVFIAHQAMARDLLRGLPINNNALQKPRRDKMKTKTKLKAGEGHFECIVAPDPKNNPKPGDFNVYVQ